MKSFTVWQRVNASLVAMLLLVVATGAFTFLVTDSAADLRQRSNQALGGRDRIDRDLILITESLHRYGSDLDTRRRSDALRDLETTIKRVQEAFPSEADLIRATGELRDFISGPLASFQKKMADLAETDPSGTQAFYNKNFPEVSFSRDRLLRDFSREIEDVAARNERRASAIGFAGIGGIALLCLASILLGRYLSGILREALRGLSQALDRMRQGDFSRRLGWNGKDRLGNISHGLDCLANDLSELVGAVQRSGLQVNSSAAEIGNSARHQQSTAVEIAATTSQIGATSRQISNTSQELLKTITEVSRVAEETGGLAGSGQAAIARMGEIMRQIMEASGAINAKLGVLSEKTSNINSVVTTITKVADQTNLLSLNAAIEAEKAGEYGLGFAVVATEIRRLADQTAVATYDIEKMVKEMQSAVGAGVLGMEKFSGEVRDGVAEVQKVSAHLAQIIHQVQFLTPRFQVVNAGMHAQASGAHQISTAIGQLGEAAQKSAELLRQSSQAIEQLNGAANGLQTSLSRFRLGDATPK